MHVGARNVMDGVPTAQSRAMCESVTRGYRRGMRGVITGGRPAAHQQHRSGTHGITDAGMYGIPDAVTCAAYSITRAA